MSGQAWTPRDEIRLLGLYSDLTAQECAEILECSVSRVYSKAHAMGLKKSAKFSASPKSGRLDGVRGQSSRFKAGHTSWNKGLKGVCTGGVETQFKAGAMPYNTMPIGSVRVTTEGYHQRKVANTGNNKTDWLNLHWELWQKHHGEIPSGHMIRFVNGDKSDIRLENLICISRAQNAQMTMAKLPPEIKKFNQLRAVLSGAINKARRSA